MKAPAPEPQPPPDPLRDVLDVASREGALQGEGLTAFVDALRERARLVLAERVERNEERLRSLEAEAAWRRNRWRRSRERRSGPADRELSTTGKTEHALADELRRGPGLHTAPCSPTTGSWSSAWPWSSTRSPRCRPCGPARLAAACGPWPGSCASTRDDQRDRSHARRRLAAGAQPPERRPRARGERRRVGGARRGRRPRAAAGASGSPSPSASRRRVGTGPP